MICHIRLTQNRPDVAGRGQGEQQTCKQDRRSGELELTVLPVVHVGGGDLHEEEDGEDHVNDGENNIIDDVLDLALGCVPSVLNGTGHIAGGAGCKGGHCHGGDHEYQDGDHGQDSGEFLVFHLTSISLSRSQYTT